MRPDTPRLDRQTMRQFGWVFIATAAGRSIGFAGLVVLARMLAPADFGLLATALLFVTCVDAVGDLGMGTALIYWPGRTRDAAQLTFVAGLVLSWVWFALAQLGAPVVAGFFQNPDAEPILRAMGWIFPIKALGQTHDALLQKEIRFRARIVPEVTLAIVKLALSIQLAFAGFGVWSLVWGQVAGQLAWTAALWLLVPWRPGRHLPVDLLRPMLRYGCGIIAVGVLSTVVHHIDLVIVGRMLGATELGLYRVASRLPELGGALLIGAAAKVLLPAFSRLQGHTGRLRESYLEVLRYISLISLPSAVAAFFAAEALVLALFGDAWHAGARILQALAAYAALRALGSPAGDLLKATGRTGLLAGLAAFKAGVLVPALLLAAGVDAATVAWTLAGVTCVTLGINLAVSSRLLNLAASDLSGALQPGAIGAVAAAGLLAGWRWIAIESVPGDLAAATAAAAAGIVVALRLLPTTDRGLFPTSLDAVFERRPLTAARWAAPGAQENSQ